MRDGETVGQHREDYESDHDVHAVTLEGEGRQGKNDACHRRGDQKQQTELNERLGIGV